MRKGKTHIHTLLRRLVLLVAGRVPIALNVRLGLLVLTTRVPVVLDLILALRRLQISQENEAHPNAAGVSVLIEPEEGPGVGVYVEDCGNPDVSDDEDVDDRYQGEDWFYGHGYKREQQQFMPLHTHTMRPPMPASA